MLRVRDRRIIPRTAAVCQIDRRSGAQVKKIQIADVIIVLMLQIQIRFPFFRMKDTAFRGSRRRIRRTGVGVAAGGSLLWKSGRTVSAEAGNINRTVYDLSDGRHCGNYCFIHYAAGI